MIQHDVDDFLYFRRLTFWFYDIELDVVFCRICHNLPNIVPSECALSSRLDYFEQDLHLVYVVYTVNNSVLALNRVPARSARS